MSIFDPWDDVEPPSPVTWAEGRLPTRTYVSRSTGTQFGRDAGFPSRYIQKVFDEVVTDKDDDLDWTVDVVSSTPGGRKQVELHVARSQGVVRRLRIQRVSADRSKLEQLLELDREQSSRLITLLRALAVVPIEGDTVVYEDQLLQDFFAEPTAIASAYAGDPERFRALIQSDANANDVIALGHRRKVAATMREWLTDDTAFAAAHEAAGGPEKAWQKLLEDNPWVLGVGPSGQFMTSWNKDRLEQTVVGRSISGVGKRADALLRTAGIVRALVFAEIKHHKTDLLGEEYRVGSWSPSGALSGAIVQVQQTVYLAVRDLDEFLQDQAADGALQGTGTFVLQPRSFVVVGSLDQLKGTGGGVIPGKMRSFELFRRNLQAPEVITFDELLARVEWHIETAQEI